MTNVINLIHTEKDNTIASKELLEEAIKNEITDVVIIGYDKAGYEYFLSYNDDPAEVIWMMERTKLNLLRSVEE